MRSDDDDFDDGYDDDDYDSATADEMACLPCPQCGVMISEDAQRCPACGEYVTVSPGLTRKGLWWWAAWSLLAILAVLWLFRF